MTFRARITVLFGLVCAASLPASPVTALHAQSTSDSSTAVTTPSEAELGLAARRVIDAAKYAAFITLDSTGRPHARTVQPVAPDSTMVVWFATNPLTRKVGEVARDRRVSLYYFDPESLAYVTLTGSARIVRDRAEQDRHWNPAWDAFYPNRASGVVLVEVTPERLEIVDIKRRISGDARTWRPPSVQLRKPSRTRTPGTTT